MLKNINNKILVVIYNMSLHESPTIRSIVDCFSSENPKALYKCELIIWDNSPISLSADVSILKDKISNIAVQYIHTPDNRSLSYIYNTLGSQVADDEYLSLYDQDSELPPSYFGELRLAQQDSWPLILPKVKCQGELVSPGRRFFARGIRVKEIDSGAISSKNLLAINSGMSILGKVFRSIKYDERLHFYGTDTYFMYKYENHFSQVFVLDTPIIHSLAEMECKSDEWHVAHATEKLRTFKIIFSDTLFEKVFVRLYLHGLQVKYWFFNLLKGST